MPTPKRKKRDPWSFEKEIKKTGRRYSKNIFIALAIMLGAVMLFDKTGLISFNDLKGGGAKSETLQVHFVDVGQGDCELIIIGDDAMLIDAGEKENGASVYKYMTDYGVKKLDYVIATHPHSDHIGGIPAAIKNMSVDTFIIPDIAEKYIPTTLAYSNLIDAIDESNAKLEYAEVSKVYELGEAKFTILAPSTDDASDTTNLNNYSVVILLEYGDNKFLFTGDAEKKEENDINKTFNLPKVDVLKCGHHGSNTSTSQAFLDIIQPDYAVIECGADNSYGHPSSDIIDRIAKYTNKIYRTDLNGNIIISSNGKDISVKTEKGNK
ncbi:competence protein ComE [Clostridia bacterium]|nr:competence protein ComE [Clostridia bacterium]